MPATSIKPIAPVVPTRATLEERRIMKKISRPEHAYSGHIPKWAHDEPAPLKRLTPILGYQGFYRNDADRIGLTFSNALAVSFQDKLHAKECAGSSSSPSSSSPSPNTNPSQTHATFKHVSFSPSAGDADLLSRPPSGPGSDTFQTRLPNNRIHAKSKMKMSSRSGYGAFDNASGYGQFMARSSSVQIDLHDNNNNNHDAASGSASGYGAFANASGYGNFAAPPPPPPTTTTTTTTTTSASALSTLTTTKTTNNQTLIEKLKVKHSNRWQQQYDRAVHAIGGKQQQQKLLELVVDGLVQRFRNRTDLMQYVRKCFGQFLSTTQSKSNSARDRPLEMTKDQFKPILLQLYCIFSDDQATALFSLYDTKCTGVICGCDQLVRDLEELVG